MTRRHLAIIGVNIIVFVVLAELLALGINYAQTGGLFYLQQRSYAPIRAVADRRLTDDALHPYFGPTHRRGARVETNNVGFSSPHDFPFVKASDKQFVIGIFGGSVGVWFCRRGAEPLAANLGRSEFFRSREIVTLCFSHEGYKQPQQLLILAYFLSVGQQFDMVLNIDGFNEVVMGAFNDERGRDISMPSPLHLDPLINVVDRSTLTPERLDSLAAISRQREDLNALTRRLSRARLASVHFALERHHEIKSRRYRAELARFAELPPNPAEASLIQVTPALKRRDGATLYQDIAAHWISSSLLMRQMLAARSVPYFHVLQPNQYFTKRRFAPDEAGVALNDRSPFKAPVEHGYPALLAAADARGLNQKATFFSALEVFDREPSPVYEDDCCHYNVLGNRLLADFIAARILGALALND